MVRSHDTTGPNRVEHLINVGDVARHLAISRSKVYQLMDAGGLPYVKLGKSRRVRWSDVLALIDKHLISCETEPLPLNPTCD